MPESKCAKCDATEFEMVPAKIKNTKFHHKFAQCSKCGAVLGVLESDSSAQGIVDILNLLKSMEARINQQFINLGFRK
jgi:ribosomal protein S27AE